MTPSRSIGDAMRLLAGRAGLSRELRLAHLRWALLARIVDDRLLTLYNSAQVPGNVFTSRGQEVLAAAMGVHLRAPGPGAIGDIFAPLIRDQAARLAFGETPLDVIRTHLGKVTGPMRGRDGNAHRGELAKGMLPMISHLGAMPSAVAGVLLARRLRGALAYPDSCIGITSIGDGGTATGALHEALNVIAIEKLPFVLVVANNQVSYSTFNDRSFACRDLVDRAIGYGLRGWSCDGTDAVDSLVAVGGAIAAARRGEGPQMVVASLLRLAGHGSHDDARYMPAELKARFGDGVELAQAAALAEGLIDQAGLDALLEELRALVRAAADTARGEANPDPERDDWRVLSTPDLLAMPGPTAEANP